jgi:hypothetical protein
MTEGEGICRVSVKGVYLVTLHGGAAPAVILEDKDGDIMPIYVGHLEALSINQAFHKHIAPRPLTHDLLLNILNRMDASVVNVVIDEIEGGVFYASLTLRKNGVDMEFDARPSDCIAIALRAEIPIYIREDILSKETVDSEMLEGAEAFDILL